MHDFFQIILRFVFNKKARLDYLSAAGVLDRMPDDIYLKLIFKNTMGHELDLSNPQTFNEKIQWLKLNDRKPIYTTMVDKYEVKDFVASIIGKQHIIPTMGVWNSFDDIDFDSLPDQFVLKCTHDSGGLCICRNKNDFIKSEAKKRLTKSLSRNYYLGGREWPYKDVKRRILAEKYMLQEGSNGLIDYKFFCFNGTPKLLYVSKGLEHHPTAKIGFYDMDGREMLFHRGDYKPYNNAVMPANFETMKDISRQLAEVINCPFVRIDLYSINNNVYFSEITFSPCSGMIPFDPIEADAELGKMIMLPNKG